MTKRMERGWPGGAISTVPWSLTLAALPASVASWLHASMIGPSRASSSISAMLSLVQSKTLKSKSFWSFNWGKRKGVGESREPTFSVPLPNRLERARATRVCRRTCLRTLTHASDAVVVLLTWTITVCPSSK